MGLRTYHRKRDFSRTPEPRGRSLRKRAGRARAHPAPGRAFAIQKHAARRLHYDFRLELDGVLVSWAIPKGPSLDPKERRLAVHVEDHPVEYGGFEGVIPKGEYGGGNVLLWDRGRWIEHGDAAAGLKKGKLKFRLEGEKLRGGWTLVRMRGRAHGEYDGKENWLLIKENDEEADPKHDIVEERPESVASGRTIEEIGGAHARTWRSNRPGAAEASGVKARFRKAKAEAPRRASKRAARAEPTKIEGAVRAAIPETLAPELATLVASVPKGDAWFHELKYDGYRAFCRIENGRARFLTREGKDWTERSALKQGAPPTLRVRTDRFGELAQSAARLPVAEAVIDGEVAVVEPDGKTSFQALQNVLRRGKDQELVFFAFDLLFLDGYDLRRAPLAARKRALAELVGSSTEGALRYSDHIEGKGEALYRQACGLGLEGVVSKRSDAPYRSGRGRDWLKTKCLAGQEFVIGGFTDPSGARKGLGALLVGVYDSERGLVYAGRVGTGFSDQVLRDLRARLESLEADVPPFANPPRGASARGAHWVRPELVADVAFTAWTRDGILRHPSYKGLREDKRPREVVREVPAGKSKGNPASAGAKRGPARGAGRSASASGRAADSETAPAIAGVRLTNPDRVLYPEQGITKHELARYYESIAALIVPQIEDRVLTLVRCPEGHEKECFYQKHISGSVPDAVKTIPVRETPEPAHARLRAAGPAKGTAAYLMVDSIEGLIALVQMGVLELHTWGSKIDRIEQPDRITIDLDPDPDLGWDAVVAAAREVREFLEGLGLGAFLKTTGGKGLHVVTPIARRLEWDEVKEFTHHIAGSFARRAPERYTAVMSKAKRTGKIFVDYLRNGRGATAVAAFSTRARAGAPVSTPLAWDELGPKVRADSFTVRTVPARLARLRRDPWEGYEKARRAITASMRKAVERS